MTSPAVKLLAGLGGGASVQLPDAILALSPVGYWKLDESSGTTANDSSGNGRNGTYTGAYTLQGAAGGDGSSYVLTAGGSPAGHIMIADNNAWSIGTGLTVFALFNPDNVGSSGTGQIVAKLDTSGGNRFEWAIAANNLSSSTYRLEFLKTNTGFSSYRIQQSSSQVFTRYDWNAVCIRYTDESVTAVDDYWANSDTEGTQATPTVVGSSTAANTIARLCIGNRADLLSNQEMIGGFAHVALFAGELSDSEIGGLMDAAQADGWF